MPLLALAGNTDYAAFSAISIVVVALFLLAARRVGSRRVLAAGTLAALAVFLVYGWFVVDGAGERERRRLQTSLEGFAPTYALELERLGHADVGAETPPADPRYLAMIEAQIRWLRVNPSVHDIYTVRRLTAGRLVFLVDSETDYDRNGRYEGERESRTPIGEPVEESDRGMESAFAGRANFNDVPVTDRWGTWVGAYAPMYDDAGRVEAILGVDYSAADFSAAVRFSRLSMIGLLALLEAVALGVITVIVFLRAEIRLSEQRRQTLHAAKEAAEAASHAKSGFLAGMSHELRTPLNAILGYSELLAEEAEELGQASFVDDLNKIRSAGRHLLGLIGDVLDLSKIEAGRMQLGVETFDVAALVQEVVATVQPLIDKKSNTLELRLAADLGTMHSDPIKVRQSLFNLLSNAAKFTERGRITLEATRERDDGRDWIRLRVTDSGIGMTPEQVRRLFTPYVQAERDTAARFGGTGLGLALARRISELLGGQVSVTSEPGRGTSFELRLPARHPETAGHAKPERGSVRQ